MDYGGGAIDGVSVRLPINESRLLINQIKAPPQPPHHAGSLPPNTNPSHCFPPRMWAARWRRPERRPCCWSGGRDGEHNNQGVWLRCMRVGAFKARPTPSGLRQPPIDVKSLQITWARHTPSSRGPAGAARGRQPQPQPAHPCGWSLLLPRPASSVRSSEIAADPLVRPIGQGSRIGDQRRRMVGRGGAGVYWDRAVWVPLLGVKPGGKEAFRQIR